MSSEEMHCKYNRDHKTLFEQLPCLRSVVDISLAHDIVDSIYTEFDLSTGRGLINLANFNLSEDDKCVRPFFKLVKIVGGKLLFEVPDNIKVSLELDKVVSETLDRLLDINKDYDLMSKNSSKAIKFHLVQKWLDIFPKTILERQQTLLESISATKIQAIARGKRERAPEPAPAAAPAAPAPAPAAPAPAPAAPEPAPAAPPEPAPAPNCCTCAFLRNRNSRVTEIIGGVVIGLATWQIMAASGLAVSAVASGGIVAGAVIAAVIIIATVKYIMNKNLKEVSVDLVADGDVASSGVEAGCS